jgi:pyruvate kinase
VENHVVDSGIEELCQELELMEKKMLGTVESHKRIIQQLDPAQQPSCINLLFYLTLRSVDIRNMQNRLHSLGLSSLANSESHVYSQMNAILERLGKNISAERKSFYTYEDAMKDIRLKGQTLFGTKEEQTVPYIMITLDKSYAGEYDKIKELLLTGMNVARINCAHDDKRIWSEMINHIHRATLETGLSCKIYMDLAGPKIRTVIPGKKGRKRKIEIQEGEQIYLT